MHAKNIIELHVRHKMLVQHKLEEQRIARTVVVVIN